MSSRPVCIALSTQLLFAICSSAQTPTPQQTIQTRQIDLSNSTPLAGLPPAQAFAFPFTCSSDGEIYVSEFGPEKPGQPAPSVPDLFAISPLASVKNIPRPLPTAYKEVDSPGFFAGRNALVTVVRASQPVDQSGQTQRGTDFYLSVTDSVGDHQELIRLNLPFHPAKAAVFGSGEFVVFGSDPTTWEPRVALLSGDGQFRRFLDVFKKSDEQTSDKTPASQEQDPEKEKVRRQKMFLSIGVAQFAPWGADIVLAMPGIEPSAIYRIRASGPVERVLIKLPDDEEINGILGSGAKDNWVVRTRSATSGRKMAESHMIVNPQEQLYEVNPWTGELLKRLDVKGPVPGEVICAADRKLAAMYLPDAPPDAPERLVLATSPF